MSSYLTRKVRAVVSLACHFFFSVSLPKRFHISVGAIKKTAFSFGRTTQLPGELTASWGLSGVEDGEDLVRARPKTLRCAGRVDESEAPIGR